MASGSNGSRTFPVLVGTDGGTCEVGTMEALASACFAGISTTRLLGALSAFAGCDCGACDGGMMKSGRSHLSSHSSLASNRLVGTSSSRHFGTEAPSSRHLGICEVRVIG